MEQGREIELSRGKRGFSQGKREIELPRDKRGLPRGKKGMELPRGKRGLPRGKKGIELSRGKARTKGEKFLAPLLLAGLCFTMGGRVPFYR